jgi:large subunit ribosomal protein L28
MSNVCMVTGARPGFGNSRSHSNRGTRRRWNVNIQKKRFWLATERRWVTLTVSARGIKTIDKRGIDAVVAELRRQGVKL